MTKEMLIGLNDFATEVHKNAVEHGCWEEERELPEILMLYVSELAEALEEYREKNPQLYFSGYGASGCVEKMETPFPQS